MAESVFADALYYIALLVPRDRKHEKALAIGERLLPVHMVTCEPVLTETFAHVSGLGPFARSQAVSFVEELRSDPSVTIVEQTHELFEAGLESFRRRLDKGYSLTDCMSMWICQQFGITRVLTGDQHFVQEGFTILLPDRER